MLSHPSLTGPKGSSLLELSCSQKRGEVGGFQQHACGALTVSLVFLSCPQGTRTCLFCLSASVCCQTTLGTGLAYNYPGLSSHSLS
jgi:hypothetical protein